MCIQTAVASSAISATGVRSTHPGRCRALVLRRRQNKGRRGQLTAALRWRANAVGAELLAGQHIDAERPVPRCCGLLVGLRTA